MRSTKGFTLSEVLIAIVVTAILVAIVFPVFAQARKNARTLTCYGNEKQMGVGLMLYLQDNDQSYPMFQYYVMDPSCSRIVSWEDAIYPYVRRHTPKKNNIAPIWTCPLWPGKPDKGEYGINGLLSWAGSGTWEQTNLPDYMFQTVTDDQVTTPADTAMIMEHGAAAGFPKHPSYGIANLAYFDPNEANWTNRIGPIRRHHPSRIDTHNELRYDFDCRLTDTRSICGFGAGPGSMQRYRHNGASTTLFCDGHVRRVVRGHMDWYRNIYIPGVYEMWYASHNRGKLPHL